MSQDGRISRRTFCQSVGLLAGAAIAARASGQTTTKATPMTGHTNGDCWLDQTGQSLQAHGGGMLLHDGAYYWYGENRIAPERDFNGTKRHAGGGVACYRSTDLVSWKSLGVVLACSEDPQHDLYFGKVLERPKVIYNTGTKKFVMWMHIDTPNYGFARAGVAIADDPAGPFQYLTSYRPNNFMSRDQTVFIDREGSAYQIGSSDENATGMISLLTDDYLKPSGKFVKVFENRQMEAFSFVEHDGKYWMIASGCTGWKPNKARSAVADSFMGPWHELPNPCVGDGAEQTFGGQSAFIIPPGPANRIPIAMFDIWRPKDLKTSGYMWLPIAWEQQKMVIRHRATWRPIA